MRRMGEDEQYSYSQSLELERSDVAVPSDWTLHIMVDLKIENRNNQVMSDYNLEGVDFTFNHNQSSIKHKHQGRTVLQVNINWLQPEQVFHRQLSCAVKVKHY